MLYGRKLRDFLPDVPDKYRWPSSDLIRKEWSDIANWREKALAKRCAKVHDKLSEHTRDLPPLSIGDAVLVQNQLGNSPRRWDRRGVIVEVLPHRQYKVMMDGSRRISLRNRKFLRKFQRVETSDNNLKNQFTVEPTSRKTETVSSPVINEPTVIQEDIPKQVHLMPN